MLGTKSSIPIIGWFAIALGFIMNIIYEGQYLIGLDNIGLCIILFTLVIYLLMTPLTKQQQKFSRLSSKMNPELQAIQKKYKGKTDQTSMTKMNEETQAVYAKYGVNPMGSCVQLLIQLPVLFALYRVIWNIPAYVDKVKAVFTPLANALIEASGSQDYLTTVAKSLNVTFNEMTTNTVIDVLYKFKPSNWTALSEQFPSLGSTISSTQTQVDHINYFLGLNIADSPMNIIRTGFSSGAILMAIGAILIPVLAALTQYLNAKLTTSMQESNHDNSSQTDTMAQSMKTMNNVMPIMSAFFCLTLPVGMGLYWIAGAVIRSIQQIVINRQIDKIDIDELAKQNIEKMNKKRAKEGLPAAKMQTNANISTRNINVSSNKTYTPSKKAQLQKEAASAQSAPQKSTSKARPGSLASKANMVQEYNETHNKRK